MGLMEEARRICQNGVQIHPDFASGRVAFAKVLLELDEAAEALTQLEKAIELSPDNLLAHSMMGDTLLKLRRPKDALRSFKMVLFLNPADERAKSAVRKWEFLSADEYESELFDIQPAFHPETDPAVAFEPMGQSARGSRSLERALSLADAFTVRGDMDKALQVLIEANKQAGGSPELEKRIELISKRNRIDGDRESDSDDDDVDFIEERRQKLETFLRRINERRDAGG
jgi:predicted Zn-dependent protease